MKISPVSARCATNLLSFISTAEKRTTEEIQLHLKSLGFGSAAISNAKRYLLESKQISKTDIPGKLATWTAGCPDPAKEVLIYKNAREFSEYKSLPSGSSFPKGEFVYLFMRKGDGIFKIGIAKDIKSRARGITYACGSFLKFIGGLDCASFEVAYEIEQNLHHEFHDKRIVGEWFALEETDVNYVLSFFAEGGTA